MAAQLQLSAAAGPLIVGIQMQEQLDNLLNSFFFMESSVSSFVS